MPGTFRGRPLERTQLFNGIRPHLFLRITLVEAQRNIIVVEECPEVGQSVVDGAVRQSLFFQRHHKVC